MSLSEPRVASNDAGDSSVRRRQEIDWLLNAIAGAIVAGKLPPDDACAWAKIAAFEVEMLGPTPGSAEALQN